MQVDFPLLSLKINLSTMNTTGKPYRNFIVKIKEKKYLVPMFKLISYTTWTFSRLGESLFSHFDAAIMKFPSSHYKCLYHNNVNYQIQKHPQHNTATELCKTNLPLSRRWIHYLLFSFENHVYLTGNLVTRESWTLTTDNTFLEDF